MGGLAGDIGVDLLIALAVLNVIVTVVRYRSVRLSAIESLAYGLVAWYLLAHYTKMNGFAIWLGWAFIVLAGNLYLKLPFSFHVFRRLRFTENLNWSIFGETFAKRMELAKRRMAAREERAKAIGVDVIEVLKRERSEKDQSRR